MDTGLSALCSLHSSTTTLTQSLGPYGKGKFQHPAISKYLSDPSDLLNLEKIPPPKKKTPQTLFFLLEYLPFWVKSVILINVLKIYILLDCNKNQTNLKAVYKQNKMNV